MGPISQLVGVVAIVTVIILPINNLTCTFKLCPSFHVTRRLLSRSC